MDRSSHKRRRSLSAGRDSGDESKRRRARGERALDGGDSSRSRSSRHGRPGSLSRSRSPRRRPSRSRSRSNERTSRQKEEKRDKRRKRTGWDDIAPDSGFTAVVAEAAVAPASGITAPIAKSLQEIEREVQERQAQAANIAAAMQSKANLSQMCRIYVGSLDYSLVESDIRSVFSAYGPIINIDMPKEGARSKGFCFVEYSAPEAAEMALNTMNGFVLKGRAIKVGRPTALGGGATGGQPQMSAAMAPMQAAGLSPADATQAGMMAAASLIASRPAAAAMDIAQSAAAMLGSNSPTGMSMTSPLPMNRVYVGNIPSAFTSEDVKSIFQVFGPILSCQLIPSNERPGTHRGYGFIEYPALEMAKMAIDMMNNFEVSGKTLKVNYATALRNVTMQPVSPGGGMMPTMALPGMPGAATGANAIPIAPMGGMPPAMDGGAPWVDGVVPPPHRPAGTCTTIELKNMVTADEVDGELNEEVKLECSKYGVVSDLRVDVLSKEDVRIYVTFASAFEAENAVPQLHGRWFGGRQINCVLFG